MVKLFTLLFCLTFLCIRIDALPLIEASLDGNLQQANIPLKGTLSITHEKSEQIDSSSFKLKGEPFQPQLIRETIVKNIGSVIISLYSFQLPPQKSGLYLLPPISVMIDGKTYQTHSSAYQIVEENPSTVQKGEEDTIFKLEAFIEGKQPFYPGERAKFIYKISYNRNVDLSQSDFPLIHPNHFKQVGDVQVIDQQESGSLTTQTLIQEVEASEVGTFTFGPSKIEGYAYKRERGQKVYASSLLRSVVPPIKIEVLPFPKDQEPLSFTRGIGRVSVQAELKSSPVLSIGDLITLKVTVGGVKNLQDFLFPLLQCQPGFSGFFEINPLPPVGDVEGNQKIFIVELRPIVAFVTAIPSIEMASFDPSSSTFFTGKTAPITLSVRHGKKEEKERSFSWKPFPAKVWMDPELPALSLAPFIKKNQPSEDPSILYFFLFLLLPFQYFLRKGWEKCRAQRVSSSRYLFREALKAENQEDFFKRLDQAFSKRREELMRIPSSDKRESLLLGLYKIKDSFLEKRYTGRGEAGLKKLKSMLVPFQCDNFG